MGKLLIFALAFLYPLAALTSCDSSKSAGGSGKYSVTDVRSAFDEWSSVFRHYNTMPIGNSDQERHQHEASMIRDLSSVNLSRCPEDLKNACSEFISYLEEGLHVPYSRRGSQRDSERAINEAVKLSEAWGKYLD